jgi:small nuclear ribonucleoprotein (snRNP)-like protein
MENPPVASGGPSACNRRKPPFLQNSDCHELGEPDVWKQGGHMLEELLGQKVIVDLRSTFVCLGTLQQMDEQFLELRNADLHDLRDTETTRELYVADSKATGIKRNRKRVWVVRAEIVAIGRLDDVVNE